MRLSKGFGLTAVTVMLLALGTTSNVRAEAVLINGSFETGDYTGWTLQEETPAIFGTWGIAKPGQTISLGEKIFDFYDSILVPQFSSGLPRTYQPSEGAFMAIQLQNGGQEHRMYQTVTLPGNAAALSWDMFYDNKLGVFAPDQCLAVHIRDLDDNILETLYLSYDNGSQQLPMSNFVYDISSHAGNTVRIDVQLKAHKNFFDVGFDNFQVLLSQSQDPAGPANVPPGWSKSNGKKIGWINKKIESAPRGFVEGLKKGWDK
jgi:hypothetical protein